MTPDDAFSSVQQCLDDARPGAEVVICDIGAVRALMEGHKAAVDTIDKLLRQSDVDGTDCCWACMWSGLDRGCGGRTPKWRGPEPGGEDEA